MPGCRVSMGKELPGTEGSHTSRCSTVFTANCISISSAFPAVLASNDILLRAMRRAVQSTAECRAIWRNGEKSGHVLLDYWDFKKLV